MFDEVLLLAPGGRTVYAGPTVSTSARPRGCLAHKYLRRACTQTSLRDTSIGSGKSSSPLNLTVSTPNAPDLSKVPFASRTRTQPSTSSRPSLPSEVRPAAITISFQSLTMLHPLQAPKPTTLVSGSRVKNRKRSSTASPPSRRATRA